MAHLVLGVKVGRTRASRCSHSTDAPANDDEQEPKILGMLRAPRWHARLNGHKATDPLATCGDCLHYVSLSEADVHEQGACLRLPGLSDILKPSFAGGNWMSILEFSGELLCNPDFLVSEGALFIIEIACSGCLLGD